MLKIKMITWFMLAVVTLSWSSVAKCQALNFNTPPQKISYYMLVQATTTEFKTGQAPGLRKSTNYSVQTITHVYFGPATLLHQTFPYPDYQGDREFRRNYRYPRQIGTTGIWCLNPKEADDAPLTPTRTGFSASFPALSGQTPDYDQIKALAQAVEKIAQAKPEQQEPLFKAYAHSAVPPLAIWAIGMAEDNEPQTALQFLHDLWADPKLPLSSQITVDHLLADLQGKDWQDSPQRLTRLQSWVRLKLSDFDVNWLLSYFSDSWQEHRLTPSVLVDLSKIAMANPQWSVASQVDILNDIEAMYNAKRLDEATAFSFYSDQLKKTKAPPMQLAAAQALSRLKLTPSQVATLKGLMGQVTDPQTLQVLQQIVMTPKT